MTTTTTNEYGVTISTDTETGRSWVVMDEERKARGKAAFNAYREKVEAALIAHGRGDEVMAVRAKQGR